MENTPIQVALSANNVPSKFNWRGRIYRIKEVHECWRLAGAWWDGEAERTFFRVRTDKGGIYELCFDHGRSIWTMAAVQD